MIDELKKMFYILICLIIIPQTYSTVLIADHTMSRMIEFTSKTPYCIVHNDRGVIQKMILGAEPSKLLMMSNNAITALEVACKEKTLSQVGFIYPGTKWCGPGNRSSSYRELGYHTAEDKCCREHDHCPAVLAPGECKRSVCNKGRYTRSHCDCDARFRKCLQALSTEVANTLGAIFFNVIQVTCFKERRPCSKWQSSYYKCDRSLIFVRMPRYYDRRNPTSLKNIFFLGNTEVARFNQELTLTIGKAVRNLQNIFENGYSEEESKILCSQWKFRPSDKYVPSMTPL